MTALGRPSTPAAPAGAAATRRRAPAGGLSADYLLVGAGCAGLSLAWHLLERGVPGRIALVDRREHFENDRTWCYWDAEPTPFDGLAARAWDRWRFADGAGEVVASSTRYRYLCLRSADFYRRVLARLAAAPNVTLALGRDVAGLRDEGDRVVAETSAGPVAGRWAFDSSGASARRAGGADPGEIRLLQHFLGLRVEADRPAFDPGCPTLMDFRVSQADGPHFVYVLPFSETEALVEDTYLFPAEVPAARRRAEVAGYLRERHGLGPGSWRAVEEESGRIPMTTERFPTRAGRCFPIGLAGGAARPSSGYAFVRIQRQARRLAALAASGRLDAPAPPPAPSGRKHATLDAVFLRALLDRPSGASEIFRRLFAGARPDAVVRFLGERSGPVDDLRVIAALPKRPFVSAALRTARLWAPRLLG